MIRRLGNIGHLHLVREFMLLARGNRSGGTSVGDDEEEEDDDGDEEWTPDCD